MNTVEYTPNEYLKPGRYLILPDMQIPGHHEGHVKAVVNYVKQTSDTLAGILCVGDEIDQPTLSNHPARTWGNLLPTFFQDCATTHDTLAEFADALNHKTKKPKPFFMQRSNHGDRLHKFLMKVAPQLVDGGTLTIQRLIGYNTPSIVQQTAGQTLPIVYNDEPYMFAPGWVICHGDEGGSSQIAGSTAMGIARKFGVSVVSGHTHKMGQQHYNTYLSGRQTGSLQAVEVGTLMDMNKFHAGYLKGGAANWQTGFAEIRISRELSVFPTIHPIVDGEFYGEGKVWKVKK